MHQLGSRGRRRRCIMQLRPGPGAGPLDTVPLPASSSRAAAPWPVAMQWPLHTGIYTVPTSSGYSADCEREAVVQEAVAERGRGQILTRWHPVEERGSRSPSGWNLLMSLGHVRWLLPFCLCTSLLTSWDFSRFGGSFVHIRIRQRCTVPLGILRNLFEGTSDHLSYWVPKSTFIILSSLID